MLIKFRSGFLNTEFVSQITHILTMRSKCDDGKTGHKKGEIYELKYSIYMNNGHNLSYEIPVYSKAYLEFDSVKHSEHLNKSIGKINNHYAKTISNITNLEDN